MGALPVGRYRLSRREAAACLAELGEAERSVGALARLEQATSAAPAPVVAEVATVARRASVASPDETGRRQGAERARLRAVVTDAPTPFRLDPRRSTAVARAPLGPDRTGIVASDRCSASRSLPLDRRRLCRAHLIRDVRKIAAYDRHRRPLGERVLDLGTRIFAARHRVRDAAIDRPSLLAEVAPRRAELRRALEDGRDPPHAVVAGAPRGNLLDPRPAPRTFARVEGVEPTNNAAERALRPAAPWRNGCFGTQGDDGARFVERIMTVVASCTQQGHRPLASLVAAITAARSGLPPPSLLSAISA